MQPYTGIASVYDIYMDHIPYDEWTDFIVDLLKKYNISKGLLLELGCGTGTMTRQLVHRGYEMIGLDLSEEMLAIAQEKEDNGNNILYLCQDMRDLELYGTVSAVVSFCSTMNYILTEEDMLKVFKRVNNYLDPKGLFVFDLDTLYSYQYVLGDNTTVDNREEGTFIWENLYYDEEMINEVNLTVFIPQKNGNIKSTDINLYKKYVETHYRRGYTIETIRSLIEEAGLEWIGAFDSQTKEASMDDSERVYIVAREKQKDITELQGDK
jgi:ubiquinone/menaquinone biosynthesis C-methylase UbiE